MVDPQETSPIDTIVLDNRAAGLSVHLAEIARDLSVGSGPIDICNAGFSAPPAAVTDLAARPGTYVVTAMAGGGPGLRAGHGRVLAVGTETLSSGLAAVGLLRIAAADRPAAAAAVGAAAKALQDSAGDPFAWVVRALVRSGVIVRAEPIEPWPWSGQGDVVAVADEQVDRIRLARANRSDDGWYSVSVLRRLSKPLTGWAARHGWSPNAITVGSLIVGLLAAASFAVGSRWALVLGALLLQVSLVVDCSDGEVARLTGRHSRTGAWLDAVTDRVKEFAAYAGLAAGAAVTTGVDLWWAAAATMVLQTTRHLTDYTFDQVQRGWEDLSARGPLLTGETDPSVGSGGGSLVTMIRRTVFLPIGERWLLISLTAALLGPTWTFVALLTLGTLSFGYALLGRALRTRAWTRGPVAVGVIIRQLDTTAFGLPLPLGGHSGLALAVAAVWGVAALAALWLHLIVPAGVLLILLATTLLGVRAALFRPAWVAPAAVAALEMSPWLLAGYVVAPTSGPWVFALLFTIAFHHYDLLYRATAGQGMPTWLTALAGGAPVRILVLALILLIAPSVLGGAVGILALYLGVVTVVVASVQWLVQGEESL